MVLYHPRKELSGHKGIVYNIIYKQSAEKKPRHMSDILQANCMESLLEEEEVEYIIQELEYQKQIKEDAEKRIEESDKRIKELESKKNIPRHLYSAS